MKNPKTGIARALAQVRTRRRLVLSGTPMQNNLAEYFTMIDFVRPGMLGSAADFAKDFVLPIEGGQHQNSTLQQVTRMKQRAHVLHTLLAPCVDRADLSVLEQYLPRKHEFVLLVRITCTSIYIYVCGVTRF